MAQGGSGKKTANSLVAMSSAAVLAVYAAGYTRTRSAAQQLDAQSAERRPANQDPSRGTPLSAEARPAAATPAAGESAAAAVPAARAEAETAAVTATIAKVPVAVPAPEPPAPTASVAAQPFEPSAAPAEPKVEAPTGSISAIMPLTPAPVAPAPVAPPPAPVTPVVAGYKDGRYLGWGTSRHGDIQAAVVIEGGRIASATIAQCWTRYSCNVIAHLPPQVAQRQSPDVDFVSGATQSANAFYYGVVDALSKAK